MELSRPPWASHANLRQVEEELFCLTFLLVFL